MSRYTVQYRASDKNAMIQPYGADSIAGYTNIGSYYHDGGGVDDIGTKPDGHRTYHHVQDLLYKIGEQNMQSVKIFYPRVTDIVSTPETVSKAAGQTQQITNVISPANAVNTAVNYSTSNAAKATVSPTGLITFVAQGTAVITISTVDGNFVDTIAVTVT